MFGPDNLHFIILDLLELLEFIEFLEFVKLAEFGILWTQKARRCP